jgi:predicted RNase H-like nuclease (RuvC/YqgF family)
MKYVRTFEQFINEKYLYEEYDKILVKPDIEIIKAAEAVEKTGVLNDFPGAGFDLGRHYSRTTSAENTIKSLNKYIKKLKRWKAGDEPGHKELHKNEIERFSAELERRTLELNALNAAEKGNVKLTHRLMVKYRKLEPITAELWKKTEEIGRKYDIDNRYDWRETYMGDFMPWDEKYK